MRRSDKEIKDRELIDKIIHKADVCRLGLAKDNIAYIVPVSFGYDGDNIYFHSSKKGRKIDFIEANNFVCFELEDSVKIAPNENNPCKWSFSFKSVIGYGLIEEIKDKDKKIEALDKIMLHYLDKRWNFDYNNISLIRVWRIKIKSITGKQSKDN
ncbi:MAG: pyridoxamine 5'-phosphate oxidase family protein [Deltaproteobacteria bacterium]|nr:pyridoxamine 5'-phosphate oxidase family protein [Deltaproteobacteria bacterium]